MKEQRICVEIDDDGRITAEAEGFLGDACLKELDQLLDGLGRLEDVVRKPEAREPPARRADHRRLDGGSTS